MKVLITDGIEQEGLSKLLEANLEVNNVKLSQEDLIKQIAQYDALIVRSATKVTKEVIDAADPEKMKIIGRGGVGTDNIDEKAASEKGIVVVNAPSGATNAVAELTIGTMLDLSRKIIYSNNQLKQGNWEKGNGYELAGKTIGIIGYGRIGKRVAQKARGLEMDVICYDSYPNMDSEHLVSLNELIQKSDYITLHVPKQEKPVIGINELNNMKKTAYLIDVSRGGNVDEDALYEALKSGTIGGAAKDVFKKEGKKGEKFQNKLLELGDSNFIALPHLGASTKEGQKKTSIEIANIIISYLKHCDISNAVNLIKKKDEENMATYNLVIMHEDKSGVFADIDSAIRKYDINIFKQKTDYLTNGYALTRYQNNKHSPAELISDIKSIKAIRFVKQ